MILEIIFAKIFLKNIKQNNDIKDTVIVEKIPKTSAFADDATIYIGGNSSLAYLETQLMDFEKVTDIKYNKTKCTRIGLGFNKDNPRKLLGFKSNSDTLKIFGYTYGHNIFIHLHFIYS